MYSVYKGQFLSTKIEHPVQVWLNSVNIVFKICVCPIAGPFNLRRGMFNPYRVGYVLFFVNADMLVFGSVCFCYI